MTDLTPRQQKLHEALMAAASGVREQLDLIYVHANRLAASEADVRAVRARIVKPVERECSG